MELSGIAVIGIGIESPQGFGTRVGIGVGLPLSEFEFNCKNGIDPSSVCLAVAQRIQTLSDTRINCSKQILINLIKFFMVFVA